MGIRSRLVAGALAAGFLLIGSTQVASAASSDTAQTNQQTPIRTCGDTRCGVRTNLAAGASVAVLCWRDAGSALGTVRWFRVTANGTRGFVSANAIKNQPSVPYCSDMEGGDALFAGQSVWSPNGRYQLIMQSDGNLVEYGPSGALWSTMTGGTSGGWFAQQTDGNGVVYTGSNNPVWWDSTMNDDARLAVQDDANIVTYTGGLALYATNQHRWTGQSLRAAGSPNPGVAGNCTWWAMDKIMNYMHRGRYPSWGGDAGWWDNNAPGAGFNVQSMPTSHAILVFEPYTNGMGKYGHVAWADGVQNRADGIYVHVTEMNIGGLNVTRDHWYRNGAGMSYITAPSL